MSKTVPELREARGYQIKTAAMVNIHSISSKQQGKKLVASGQ
jgi:hypothetical protein